MIFRLSAYPPPHDNKRTKIDRFARVYLSSRGGIHYSLSVIINRIPIFP